tara:strand:- start:57 stop:551 length:495 start_codon:yes stop_codon:yes gene_type:complete
MLKIMNLDFSNNTIGSIEISNENITNLEINLTKTKFTISFKNNNEVIKKEIKNKKNEDIIDFIEIDEEPVLEPQRADQINIEDYKTIFFTEFLNKNYNIYKFLVSDERNLKKYFDYINSLNELDKELFSYLLDKDAEIINNIKDNILFDYSQLSITLFIKEKTY